MSKQPLISSKKNLRTRSFRVSDEDIAEIDKISQHYGVSRSEVIRQAILLLQKEYRESDDESDSSKE